MLRAREGEPPVLALIDMETGNLRSVCEAFARIGAGVSVVGEPGALRGATAIVLPGVGAFGPGMASLRARGLVAPLVAAAARGVPLLGICLGMQLLADESAEHGCHEGLGLIPGRVIRLERRHRHDRLPNQGWCDVAVRRSCPVAGAPGAPESYYFAHSFWFCADEDAHVTAVFAKRPQITAAVGRGRVFGVQFHPEKSQDAGLDLLARFCALAGTAMGVA